MSLILVLILLLLGMFNLPLWLAATVLFLLAR
jgi:hypothetical protein